MDFVKRTVAENFGGAATNLAASQDQFHQDQVPQLDGKVAVVTGGSDGIGFAVSHCFLKKNISKLFIVSEGKEKMDGALEVFKKDLGEDAAKKIVWLQTDLSDWVQVTKTADKISEQADRLDILCLNSARGIMTYQLAENGVDRHMAVNHVGHVVLTSHLLPLIKKTAEKDTVRIVAQSSNAHQGAPSDTKFESLEELNRDLGPNGQYGRSKLANLLYMRWLANHVKSSPNILANATHPGFVSTTQSKVDIHEPYPILGYGMSVGMEPFKKTPEEGCLPMLYCATVTKASGQYVCPPAIVEEGSSMSQDAALGEQLMKLTSELVAMKTQAKAQGCPLDATDGIDSTTKAN